jgi:hypothetical protein
MKISCMVNTLVPYVKFGFSPLQKYTQTEPNSSMTKLVADKFSLLYCQGILPPNMNQSQRNKHCIL